MGLHNREKLVIVLTIIAFIIMGMAMFGGCVDQRQAAEHEASVYLHQMYPDAQHTHVTCMSYDTDSNGYVSCDAVVDGEQVALECGATAMCFFACNNGCKLRPMPRRLPVVGGGQATMMVISNSFPFSNQ